MTLGPDVWGPHGWKFLHFVAVGYPDFPSILDKSNYEKFFKLFGEVIPCPICANHFKENLKKHKIEDYLDSKLDLINWTIKMHNEVNKKNNKKEYTFEEGLKMIKDGTLPLSCSDTQINNNNNFNNYNNDDNSIFIIILLIVVICILVIHILKK